LWASSVHRWLQCGRVVLLSRRGLVVSPIILSSALFRPVPFTPQLWFQIITKAIK
uniref:Uncharacterized protein n=1 Tax=Loxodonta africana TaxID=9785 RepID=G3U4X7_LOXAF